MPEDYISIGNDRLAVFRSNRWLGRPTLVFLHDSLGCVALWRDFPHQVGGATECNVLIYDRRGYGQSNHLAQEARKTNYLEEEADLLHALLEAYGIEAAILFGHSDGGSIALIAAGKYPQRIRSIIVEGAHIFVEEVTLASIQQAVVAYEISDLKRRLEKYHGDKTDRIFKAWTQTWLSEEYRGWNIEHFLPQIQCPVLVIQGKKDEYGILRQVEGIASQVSGAVSQWIVPGVGHSPHKDAAVQMLTETVVFIQKYQ